MRLAVLALLAAGCGVGAQPPLSTRQLDRVYLNPRGQVNIDESTCSADDQAIIRQAAADWAARTEGFVDLQFANRGMPFRCIDRAENTYGHTTRWPVVEIVVDPNRTGPAALRTAIHEFGHALGLTHSKLEADVMFTPNNGNPAISDNDVERLCAIWRC